MAVTECLNRYMKHNNYKKTDISRLSDIPYTTIDGLYKKGTDNIKLSTLNKLKNLIGCTLDELVYGNIVSIKSFLDLNCEEISVLDDYRKLNAEGQRKVKEYTKDLAGNFKYTVNDCAHDIFEQQDIHKAASGLTPTEELSEHNKSVMDIHYNKKK